MSEGPGTRTTLLYGTSRLAVPAAWASWPALDAPGLPAVDDPAGAWAMAARAAAARVSAALGSRGRLALIVPDRTRALPLPELLPPVVDALEAHGIARGRLVLVPASGIHRPMTHAELSAWTGAPGGIALAPHDADAPAVRVGRTGDGIDVVAHPAAARADALLALGRIVFHYLAGFGGGRKMLVPGVAARRTIHAVHARCLHAEAGRGRHPRAANGVLDGNPVHEAASAAARLFPPATVLHVALARDGRIARACAGDAVDDHARLAREYAAANEVVLEAPLDAVAVSAGGHPTDRDLVQAHKALEAAAPVVRDGGVVILAAACGEGIGNREVERALGRGHAAAIEAGLRAEFRVGEHTALALRLKTARLRVIAVTELPDEALALAGMERARSLDHAASLVGSAARGALAPRGGSLLYRLAAARP